MNRHLQGARHLICAGDQLAKMAALLEQVLRVRLLEIARGDFRRRDLCRDGQHWQARPVAVEQAVDEMQIAWSAAAGADGKLTREMRLAGSGKRRDLLVPHMNPSDLALMAQRVGEPVETVADDSINALHSRCGENLNKLIRDPLCHHLSPSRSAQSRGTSRRLRSMFKRFPSAGQRRYRRGCVATARRPR